VGVVRDLLHPARERSSSLIVFLFDGELATA
jgi:hypothetical protein